MKRRRDKPLQSSAGSVPSKLLKSPLLKKKKKKKKKKKEKKKERINGDILKQKKN